MKYIISLIMLATYSLATENNSNYNNSIEELFTITTFLYIFIFAMIVAIYYRAKYEQLGLKHINGLVMTVLTIISFTAVSINFKVENEYKQEQLIINLKSSTLSLEDKNYHIKKAKNNLNILSKMKFQFLILFAGISAIFGVLFILYSDVKRIKKTLN